ncbi:hypothetical protein ABTE14_19565, partial [Acinetobacter baumannii]
SDGSCGGLAQDDSSAAACVLICAVQDEWHLQIFLGTEADLRETAAVAARVRAGNEAAAVKNFAGE